MCKYSLESYRNRKVSEGETVVSGNHYSGHGAVFTPKGASRILACVTHFTRLTFEDFNVDPSVFGFRARAMANSSIFKHYAGDVESKIGTRQVATLWDGGLRPTMSKFGLAQDVLEFEDGTWITIEHIARGLEAYVGVKPEKKSLDQKLGVDEAGMRIAALDMNDPKDKPENEEEERAPQSPPEDQPADAPAREPERAHALIDALEPVNPHVIEPHPFSVRRWF